MQFHPSRVAGPLVLLGLLLPLAGCGTTAVYYEDPEEVPTSLVEDHPDVVRTRGWLTFPRLRLVARADGGPPEEVGHLEATFVGGLVMPPFGEVQGLVEEAPRGRILTRGWLQVTTRAFHATATGSPPAPPYLPGWQDTENGGFYPSAPLVTAQDAASAPEERASTSEDASP